MGGILVVLGGIVFALLIILGVMNAVDKFVKLRDDALEYRKQKKENTNNE